MAKGRKTGGRQKGTPNRPKPQGTPNKPKSHGTPTKTAQAKAAARLEEAELMAARLQEAELLALRQQEVSLLASLEAVSVAAAVAARNLDLFIGKLAAVQKDKARLAKGSNKAAATTTFHEAVAPRSLRPGEPPRIRDIPTIVAEDKVKPAVAKRIQEQEILERAAWRAPPEWSAMAGKPTEH